ESSYSKVGYYSKRYYGASSREPRS
ncbi:hypothetical protein AVDCRST_MAG94-2474, partial [uncultured Leptolyngbya sp.]